MKRDIHKFSKWLEETLRVGVADEQALRTMKLAQKTESSAPQPSNASAKER